MKDGEYKEYEANRIFSVTPVDNLGIIKLNGNTNIVLAEFKKKDIEEIVFKK